MSSNDFLINSRGERRRNTKVIHVGIWDAAIVTTVCKWGVSLAENTIVLTAIDLSQNNVPSLNFLRIKYYSLDAQFREESQDSF